MFNTGLQSVLEITPEDFYAFLEANKDTVFGASNCFCDPCNQVPCPLAAFVAPKKLWLCNGVEGHGSPEWVIQFLAKFGAKTEKDKLKIVTGQYALDCLTLWALTSIVSKSLP